MTASQSKTNNTDQDEVIVLRGRHADDYLKSIGATARRTARRAADDLDDLAEGDLPEDDQPTASTPAQRRRRQRERDQ